VTATSSDRRVTLRDIARHSGVSKSTVSLVLQGSSLVKAETRASVLGSIEDLGYVYNRGAASLRKASTNIVGMVINDLANPFFAELAVGIERVFQAAGYIPLMANTSETVSRQAEVLKSMREHDIAGLIICPARGTDAEDLKALARPGFPLVTAMRRVKGVRTSSVVPNNASGARRATEHLIKLGHRRIAFVGGYPDMTAHEERCAGYQAALAEHGLEADPRLIIDGPATRETGHLSVRRLLDLSAAAALCFNDVVAFGVLDGLAAQGLRAGADFALVGFDDLRDARHTAPPLTTVAVDTQVLGERAANAVLRMIHGDTRTEDYVSDVKLVVRESCGAAMGRIAE
jgi:LacI family transcriptional regulator